jgi:hypothetical protein
MGAVSTHRARRAVVSPLAAARREDSDEHPLLALQRSAGNQAVAALVQRRRERPDYFSKIANAPSEHLYKGKCDADPKGAAVQYKWSRGLTGKQVSINFACGPQSFKFSTYIPYFGDRFPWGMEEIDGGSAWVEDNVEKALDDIRADFDDSGPQFWGGYHVMIDLLTRDLHGYCED